MRTSSVALATLAAGLVMVVTDTAADSNDQTASAMFGRGLNTPPTSPSNHVVLPQRIKVKAGGVVDFAVAGFHNIVIFKPGFTLDDLEVAGGGTLPSFPPVFVMQPDPTVALPAELADHVYYRGINPAGGPPATPVSHNPDNGSNRGEPVAFLEKGRYLVICNVRPHLVNGMFAYVDVN